MTSWAQILDADAGGEDILPPPEHISVDERRYIDVSYRRDEDSGDIFMCERRARTDTHRQKMPKAVLRRQRDLRKFGTVAAVPKGQIEQGVTQTKMEEVFFQWDGIKAVKPKSKPVARKPTRVRPSQPTQSRQATEGKFIPVHLRASFQATMDDDEKKYEIKISNLPQNTEAPNVQQLIKAFYYNILSENPPYRIRIKIKTTFRENEKWCIVDFPNERRRDLAIEHLNGHKLGHHVLTVSEYKPRPPRR